MKVKKEMNKPIKIILIVLVVLLLAAGIYFLVTELKEARYTREMSIFEQGFTYGYTNAVMQIINISDTCQPFPVYLGNESRTLISVNCLNLA